MLFDSLVNAEFQIFLSLGFTSSTVMLFEPEDHFVLQQWFILVLLVFLVVYKFCSYSGELLADGGFPEKFGTDGS